MLVSIITVAYNSENTISRTIESVLNQTYNNIEYIIIDGDSKDNTVKIAEAYKEKFKNGKILKIVSEPDDGMYDALNKGINIADGEIVGSINSDDWYEPQAVEKMVDLYLKEKYDVAWGSIRVITSKGSRIKHAKINYFWTTTGWCHPAMFAKRTILLKYPYVCKNIYDDFNFVTSVYCDNKRIVTLDQVVSNFTFGGMSTQRKLADVWYRSKIKYEIYRDHGMSRLYWFHCLCMELAKYILG